VCGEDLGRELAKEGEGEDHADGRKCDDASSIERLDRDQRPHRRGEDGEGILDQDDGCKEAFLIAEQRFERARGAAAALGKVTHADAVNADDSNLDAVDDGESDDGNDEDEEG
jgi:hypothetical protein